MRTKYRVYDWAGNDLSDFYPDQDSFEDSWGLIYERFDSLPEDEFDEQMSEFEVRPVKAGAPERLKRLVGVNQ